MVFFLLLIPEMNWTGGRIQWYGHFSSAGGGFLSVPVGVYASPTRTDLKVEVTLAGMSWEWGIVFAFES